MSSAKVLVVDDEPRIVQTLRAYLEREGYQVESAMDGPSALQAIRAFEPDLVILDIMLPGMDGMEVLRLLRQERGNAPNVSGVYVLMLTAKSDEIDRIVGLTVGADDYVTKPFSPRELVARVKAILRRGRAPAEGTSSLVFRRLRIDPEAHQVWRNGEAIDLTSTEFDLLYTLARHRGHVLGREQVIQQVWGHDYYGDDRVVDVYIRRIRKKIEDDPENPTLIVTVRGTGYRFEDEPA